jgi:hypothetical protein
VIDIVEILIHWYAGRSQHELAASLDVDRKTLRKYTGPARAAGFAPGGPPMGESDWRTLVTDWFPELCDAGLRQVSWPRIECHRDYIAGQLKAGVTAATIHQRLSDEHDLDASVASLRRWVRANLPEDARRAQVTVLRDTPPPGSEGQIDYGRLGMWFDPGTGRRRTVWAFVMVLCCSRHMFVRPTLSMDQAEWTAAHVEAFAFFAGVPARLLDRLINNSHQLLMNGASYRPHKRPGRVGPPGHHDTGLNCPTTDQTRGNYLIATLGELPDRSHPDRITYMVRCGFRRNGALSPKVLEHLFRWYWCGAAAWGRSVSDGLAARSLQPRSGSTAPSRPADEERMARTDHQERR